MASLGETTLGIQTFSKGHWADGDHIGDRAARQGGFVGAGLVQPRGRDHGQGASYGIIARSGDARGVAAPAWNHNGDKIVYMSTDAEEDGQPGGALQTSTWSGTTGARGRCEGRPRGLRKLRYNEYYPSFSADDQLIAFDRIRSGEDMYNQPNAEVFVIPAAGGTRHGSRPTAPPLARGKVEPGHNQQLAEMVTGGADGRRQDVLLGHLLLDPQRGGQPAALPHRCGRGRGQLTTHGALYSVEPAREREQSHAGVGRLQIPPVPPPVVN